MYIHQRLGLKFTPVPNTAVPEQVRYTAGSLVRGKCTTNYMSRYVPTIGLEIHAQLKTQTKMFCNSKNDPDETRPNVNVCPVCMGHPGTLPVINKAAVKSVLKVGVAVGGALADFTEWDRKNYFYPDIPKGYQITQYKYPLVSGGTINGVDITRIHLEEDTGINKHKKDYSLVDFNRAGVPLMELVTEPVICSAEEAVTFAKEFQLLLRYLDVAEANMEKGELRVEVNISVSKDKKLGTKTEIKNLNSFRSVGRSIEYETKRQTALLERGGEVVHETRGWDENKQETFSQRRKEFSEDYRYFPEPDLPKLKLSEIPEFAESLLKKDFPELPWERRRRYVDLGLEKEDAEVYVRDEPIYPGGVKFSGAGTFFENCLVLCRDDKELMKLISKDIISDLTGIARKLIEETKVSTGIVFVGFPDAVNYVDVIRMFKNKEISSTAKNEIIRLQLLGDPRPWKLSDRFLQKSDEGELKKISEQIIKNNPKVVKDYKGGKESSIQFLVGQAMKSTKGAANPTVLQKLFKELLKKN